MSQPSQHALGDSPRDQRGRRPVCLGRTERGRRTAQALQAAAATDDDNERKTLHDEVVMLNLSVAEALASRYRNRGIDSDDLQQVAYEGLIKAVSRFDVSRELDFLTFAVPTVRGEIMRYFRDHGWMVRPPRRIQERQRDIQHALQELGAFGHEPTPAEVIEHLGLTRAEYDQAIAAYGAFTPVSLDLQLTDNTSVTLGDLVLIQDTDPSDDAETRILLRPLLRSLPGRDRRVLYLRYHDDLTQREIGAELGVTQMQVSRILTKLHRRLRQGLAGDPEVADVPA